jgi:hypothetical protein
MYWTHSILTALRDGAVGPDLMENAKKSVRAMIDWLVRDQGLSLRTRQR